MKKRFVFAFETLLKFRERQQEVKRAEHLKAKQKLDEKLGEIKSYYDSVDAARQRISDLERAAPVDLQMISEIHQFISGQKFRIERARLESRSLMQELERALEELVEASRETKILVKLKEKRKQDFDRQKKKDEIKQIDDLVTMRAKRS